VPVADLGFFLPPNLKFAEVNGIAGAA